MKTSAAFPSRRAAGLGCFESPDFAEHEQVSFFHDAASGLRAIVVIHNTVRGPALGGCRMHPYPSDQDALTDALRLARAMSCKNAVAGLPFGGGKSVIIGDPRRDKTPALLRAMARCVDSLGGRYIAADDVGTTVRDMELMRTVTRHAAGMADENGEPCPATAWGVFHAMRAVARHAFDRDSLRGLRVAVQGLGSVGFKLSEILSAHGARLQVADLDAQRVARAVEKWGAQPMLCSEILGVAADILAPCAMGGVINDVSIPQLRCRAIVGAANNQLAAPEHADALADAGILYAPDFVVNAGGVIDVAHEGIGYDPQRVLAACESIHDTVASLLECAQDRGVTPLQVAEDLAAERLRRGRAWPRVEVPGVADENRDEVFSFFAMGGAHA